MKVATWNVNSIRARAKQVLAWIEDNEPDVLCLQETKVPDDKFPVAELEAIGYASAAFGQRAYNGVAIVSRAGADDVVRGIGDDDPDDDQARIIAATCAGVRVVCVYVPNGQEPGSEQFAYKLRWLERLRHYLEATCDPSAPVILCGDFNVAPEDRDVHDPSLWTNRIMCTEEEREGLAGVTGWGLGDTLRALTDDAGIYSWWDYRMSGFKKDRGLRIDQIYATDPLLARCADAFVDRSARAGKGTSDHAPVVAVFED